MGQSCESPRLIFASRGQVGRRRQEEKPRSFEITLFLSRFPNKSPFSPRASSPPRAAKGNICACAAIGRCVYFPAHSLKSRVCGWGEAASRARCSAVGAGGSGPHAPTTWVCSCFLAKAACNHYQTSLRCSLINPGLLRFSLQDPQPINSGTRAKAAAADPPSVSQHLPC